MIIIDVMEYDGRNVKVYLDNGEVIEGKMEYVPSFSQSYNFRQPKHFYIGKKSFRAHHVEKIELIKGDN